MATFCKYIFSFLMVALLSQGVSNAQVITPGSDQYDYMRILQLRQDTLQLYFNHFDFIRYYAPDEVQHDIWGLYNDRLSENGIKALPIYTRFTYNSQYDRSRNNGPLWYGKGITQELHAGFQARYGKLNITFQPVVFYSQNQDFEIGRNPYQNPWATLPPKSEFSYPYAYQLDYVQRFGDKPFVRFHPGQSDISMHIQNARFGVATQNMQMGHSWYSPIVMGANAPGVLHAYIQNPRPIYLWIGHFEFKQTWGVARESDYFDDVVDNNNRYFTSFSGAWMPRYMKGLHLGFNRVFFKRGDEFRFFSDDLVATMHNFNSPINEDGEGFQFNDDYFQMTSIAGRWTFSDAGFEANFEYVRNDFGGGPFGPTPEHSRAYTLGFTKIHELIDASLMALTAEISTNGATRTGQLRQPASYYVHSIVEQGFTNEGQLLGSYVGPGGTAYNIFLRRYTREGMHGFTIDYLRRDEDYYYRNFEEFNNFDHEFSLGYRGVIRRDKFDLGLMGLLTWRKNMHMIPGNHVNQVTLGVSFTYR